jgi:hypothetical protein
MKFFDGKPNVRKEIKLKTPRDLQVRKFALINVETS